MSITISANERKSHTKGVRNALRSQGRIPAVVYGSGENAVSIDVDFKDFRKAEGQGLINLSLNGETHQVMVRDTQIDALSREIKHIDFYRVKRNQKVETEVPLLLTGEAVGVKEGGILQQTMRQISIQCLPDAIPDKVELDVSSLSVGDSRTVSAISFPSQVEPATSLETVVVTIVAPQQEKEVATETEADEEDQTETGTA
ncbi:50S ribosomal protein L25 [Hazenella sp. IB182357]|uniref:Large ribosomal subunit protein bL25 n=1 Tax=Polycladospora coralii TaxID=2771432 RepID=A0A926RUK3_9BACL|nr:50S ribosomal protein L25 [Polycladospora coralii]MBD1372464.1 50S ribosomal protein L25 [Polycladospora coralii]MBS7531786.1 50S ribosomal protein L25 [Polycladospora coralii]